MGVARGGGVRRRWRVGFVAVLAVTAGGERMEVRRRGEVAYLTAVFILAAAASGMLIFKLYDRAVQLYDQTGDVKAVRLVKLGIATWLIMVLSTLAGNRGFGAAVAARGRHVLWWSQL